MAFNITIHVNSSIYCYIGDVMNIHEKLLREISNEMLQKGDNAWSNTCSEAAIHELENYIAALRALRKELKGTTRIVSSQLERVQHASH